MQLILNPPREDKRIYGILAHVHHGERKRAMESMTKEGLRLYCKEIESLVEKQKKGRRG